MKMSLKASPSNTIVVLGGGITGLAAAWELSNGAPGDTRIVVLEQGESLGGKLQASTVGGRLVDVGPDAFLARRPEAIDLCKELGIGADLVAPGAEGAYVWARGRLRRLPEGLAMGIPTRWVPLARSGILDLPGLARAAVDLLPTGLAKRNPTGHSRVGRDTSVGELVRLRLGDQVATRLAGPLIGGINAADIDLLSAQAAFPSLLDASRDPGSLMRSLRPRPGPGPHAPSSSAPPPAAGQSLRVASSRQDLPHGAATFLTLRTGLSSLAARLGSALVARGVDLRLGSAAHDIQAIEAAYHAGTPESRGPSPDPGGLRQRPGGSEQSTGWIVRSTSGDIAASGVVVALPAFEAAAVLRSTSADLADELDTIRYSSVSLVTLSFADTAIPDLPRGTGFLVPADAGMIITACTLLTSKWPLLKQPGLSILRASVGRDGDDRHLSIDDEELVEKVLHDLRAVLGVRARPEEALVTRWPRAFPQYQVGHYARVARIDSLVAALPGLALAGAAYRGVGIPACIGSGRHAARVVLSSGVLSSGGCEVGRDPHLERGGS